MYLTQDCSLIASERLTKGTLTATPIDGRTVIKHALLLNAVSVILLHNHPSGNPQPGTVDIRQTERVRSACSLLDISLLDHIILAEDSYFSFAENQTMNY